MRLAAPLVLGLLHAASAAPAPLLVYDPRHVGYLIDPISAEKGAPQPQPFSFVDGFRACYHNFSVLDHEVWSAEAYGPLPELSDQHPHSLARFLRSPLHSHRALAHLRVESLPPDEKNDLKMGSNATNNNACALDHAP